MLKNPIIKKIIEAILMAGVGFVLLNAAFMLAFFVQTINTLIVNLFTPVNLMQENSIVPPINHILFVLLILFFSWLVYRAKFDDNMKATYTFVPVAVILVSIGMFTYPNQILVYTLGSAFILAVLYYLFRTKRSWHYYFVVILLSITLALGGMLGMEI